GLGGRTLELFQQTASVIAPFDKAQALDAIERSGALKLLEGFRGGPKADVGALAELMVKVGDLAVGLGERLNVLDLNPVIVSKQRPKGCIADARLILNNDPTA